MSQEAKPPLRVLMELRPALSGHAGIPQSTRLLFRGLALLEGVRVEGLLQSSAHVLSRGLPPSGAGWLGSLSTDRQMNRLGRVVISIEQRTGNLYAHATLLTIGMLLKHLLGGRQRLTRFEATHFRDFMWRRFFARTLPADDFDLVLQAGFRIARLPWEAMHIGALVTGQLGNPVYPRLDTADFDVMICETPYPATVARSTRLVVHYHDAIPLLMPHTISDRRWHQAYHYGALRSNVRHGAWFACVSDATRNDLLSIFPQAEPRAVTIHNMVSPHFHDGPSDRARIPEIIRTRLNTRLEPPLEPGVQRRLLGEIVLAREFDYLLIVSTIEPRKNHLTLLSAWEQLRAGGFPALKLVIVGELGWHHELIVRKLRRWLDRGEAFLLEDVMAEELRVLYAQAKLTVCPSFGEGFDFSGVEAMRSGCAVAASDIPVHREVFGDAAQYFNPYSVDSLVHAVESVIDPAGEGLRQELIERGARVAGRYTQEAILPKWQEFLTTSVRAPVPNRT
ncbi:MAG: glycosyltransferase family 4 protein [Steroidobacteraceae bacterium]